MLQKFSSKVRQIIYLKKKKSSKTSLRKTVKLDLMTIFTSQQLQLDYSQLRLDKLDHILSPQENKDPITKNHSLFP